MFLYGILWNMIWTLVCPDHFLLKIFYSPSIWTWKYDTLFILMESSSTPEAELITTKCQKKEFKLKVFWLSIYIYEKWSLQTQKQSIFHQNPYRKRNLKVILFYIHLRAWARIIWQFYNQKEQFILLNRMTFFSKYDFRGQNTF